MPKLNAWRNQDEFRNYMHGVELKTLAIVVIVVSLACIILPWWPQ